MFTHSTIIIEAYALLGIFMQRQQTWILNKKTRLYNDVDKNKLIEKTTSDSCLNKLYPDCIYHSQIF